MDQNYSTLKNQSIIAPTTSVDLGTSTNRYGNIYLAGNINLGNVVASESTLTVPKIASLTFPNSASAANPSGGETITINGSGFASGATVYIASVLVSVSTVVNSTTITFTSPVKTHGNYMLSVVNSDGASATFVPGITYSDMPAFSTSAGSLGSSWEGNAVSTSISASSDSNVSFSVTSGTLPSGLSLSSIGAITGTLLTSASGDTTYNFTVTATDQEQQKSTQNYSYTVTGDTLTWASPANNSSYSYNTGVAISNISLSASSQLGRAITYSANALPTGLSLSANVISGTPTVAANTVSLISAVTSTKTANIQLNFAVTTLPMTVDYLVVAGGGGGGGQFMYAGGGGAGGYLNGTFNTTGGTYTVSIGGGGNGETASTPTGGSNSTLAGTGITTVTTYGGGRGAGTQTGGGNGGSGGGESANGGGGGKGVYPGSAYINATRQGYDGGGGSGTFGGGGGGAGGVSVSQAGGTGLQWVNGTYYAGGGGGSNGTGSGTGKLGGTGGGGQGGNYSGTIPGYAGTTNTGGGGGGGTNSNGGNGGSGVAIFRVLLAVNATATTGSPTVTTDATYRYYKFTSSGTITF